REPLSSAVELSVREIDLQRLFPGFKLSAASAGLIGGAGRLDATGNSVAEMLGSMTGDVVLRMDGGRVSKLLLELADLDVADSAVLWVAGDKSIPIRCLVADFHADDGRMLGSGRPGCRAAPTGPRGPPSRCRRGDRLAARPTSSGCRSAPGRARRSPGWSGGRFARRRGRPSRTPPPTAGTDWDWPRSGRSRDRRRSGSRSGRSPGAGAPGSS